jgi:hypothetical protein
MDFHAVYFGSALPRYIHPYPQSTKIMPLKVLIYCGRTRLLRSGSTPPVGRASPGL